MLSAGRVKKGSVIDKPRCAPDSVVEGNSMHGLGRGRTQASTVTGNRVPGVINLCSMEIILLIVYRVKVCDLFKMYCLWLV